MSADAVLVLGCTFTAPEACYQAFETALSRFAYGLIDFPRLFTGPRIGRNGAGALEFGARHGVKTVPIASYRIPEEQRGIPEEQREGELFHMRATSAV